MDSITGTDSLFQNRSSHQHRFCDGSAPLLKDFAGLLIGSSRTFGTTDIGRKSTLCVEWQVNDLRQTLTKSMPD
jgi:hypothetical protein